MENDLYATMNKSWSLLSQRRCSKQGTYVRGRRGARTCLKIGRSILPLITDARGRHNGRKSRGECTKRVVSKKRTCKEDCSRLQPARIQSDNGNALGFTIFHEISRQVYEKHPHSEDGHGSTPVATLIEHVSTMFINFTPRDVRKAAF